MAELRSIQKVPSGNAKVMHPGGNRISLDNEKKIIKDRIQLKGRKEKGREEGGGGGARGVVWNGVQTEKLIDTQRSV